MTMAALSLALAVDTPAAEREAVRAKVVIDYLDPSLSHGRLTLGKKVCRENRVVWLWWRPGGGQPFVVIGADKTNDLGWWLINPSMPRGPGEYYVSARRDSRGDFDCLSDESPRRWISPATDASE